MRLAKYGRKQYLTATIVLVFMAVLSGILMYFTFSGGCLLLVISLIFWGLFLALFRDPHRVIGQDKTELVAPADGIIKDIELIPNASCEDEGLQELFAGHDILRIGIAQSVLDVHINRVPCGIHVKKKVFRDKVLPSPEDKSGKENAFVLLAGIGEIEGTQFPVALRQISSSSLKRIVCSAEEGEIFKKGKKYGMIRYSSRTELYLPAKTPVSIIGNTGERVVAGKTVLAVFSQEKPE